MRLCCPLFGTGTSFSSPFLRMAPLEHKGLEYDEKVLPSIGNEVLKAVVAQFNTDQLLTECSQVLALVQSGLTERTKNFNIVLDDVAITHLSYLDLSSSGTRSP
ncbi:hypothetical protein SO802_029218 [Lithocarpus litseifolius]|uniref:Prohibitin n=1 Tax=Lithocarpus litseifolius TaxID=425828 RepID=A0AAW2BVS0_9ROSI